MNKKSIIVCSVEVMVGSIIKPTYSKVPTETKVYHCEVEDIQPSKSGTDSILRVKLLDGGYRSLLVSQITELA